MDEAATTTGEAPVRDKEDERPESVELSRDAILSQRFVPRIIRVEVPEWGGHVYVRELSGRQRDAFELTTVQMRGNNQQTNLQNLRARLVAFTVVDKAGHRLFSDEDVKELGNKSAVALTRVYREAAKLSNVSDEDVEVLTGSLGEDQNGASGSD